MLPITLVSFTANYNAPEQNVQLTWETASEKYSKSFTIQRSADGQTWDNVTTITAAGNSDDYLYYETFDNYPVLGVSYYRLILTDKDDITTVKKTTMLDITPENSSILIAPNPASSYTNISFNSSIECQASLNIYDVTGRVISSTLKNVTKGVNNYLLNTSAYSNGVYFININGTPEQYSKKLVVNH